VLARRTGIGTDVELQARVEDQRRVGTDAFVYELAGVVIAYRNGLEPPQTLTPALLERRVGVVAAETRRVRDQTIGAPPLAEKGGHAAIPGMVQVPYLVAADDERSKGARVFGRFEREWFSQGQRGGSGCERQIGRASCRERVS